MTGPTGSAEQPASTRHVTRSGMGLGGLDRDVAAQRQADERRRRRSGASASIAATTAAVAASDRERLAGERAVPRQVHGDAPVAAGQPAELRPPLAAAQARPVEEHDRRGVARADRRPRPGSGRDRLPGRPPMPASAAGVGTTGAGQRAASRRIHVPTCPAGGRRVAPAIGLRRPCARSPRAPPACGSRGRACRGCSRRASGRSAP